MANKQEYRAYLGGTKESCKESNSFNPPLPLISSEPHEIFEMEDILEVSNHRRNSRKVNIIVAKE